MKNIIHCTTKLSEAKINCLSYTETVEPVPVPKRPSSKTPIPCKHIDK